MKIKDILLQQDAGVSFEFFPPKTEKGKENLKNAIAELKELNPLYASMTYGASGADQDKTKEAVDILLEYAGFEVMPHLTCIGADKNTINNMLDYYKSKGIDNIMALRGDIPEGEDNFSFHKDFTYAKDLVKFIKDNNDFSIGVAVYPEGHIEAASLEEDIEHAKEKIDCGADFAVTQMFFDNSFFYSLVERMNKKNITVPILPGILPLTDLQKAKRFASTCKVSIPKDIEDSLSRFQNSPKDMEKVGVEYTIKQCRDLKAQGFKKIHFFTLNRPQVIKEIVKSL